MIPELMLHQGARASTSVERPAGPAAPVLARFAIRAGDVRFIASNSDRNAFHIKATLEA